MPLFKKGLENENPANTRVTKNALQAKYNRERKKTIKPAAAEMRNHAIGPAASSRPQAVCTGTPSAECCEAAAIERLVVKCALLPLNLYRITG